MRVLVAVAMAVCLGVVSGCHGVDTLSGPSGDGTLEIYFDSSCVSKPIGAPHVYVDGTDSGVLAQGSVMTVSVSAGTHTVLVQGSDYAAWGPTSVVVDSGVTTRVPLQCSH